MNSNPMLTLQLIPTRASEACVDSICSPMNYLHLACFKRHNGAPVLSEPLCDFDSVQSADFILLQLIVSPSLHFSRSTLQWSQADSFYMKVAVALELPQMRCTYIHIYIYMYPYSHALRDRRFGDGWGARQFTRELTREFRREFTREFL